MAKPRFSEVWSRIVAHAGEPFETKTGKPFTYMRDKETIVPSRTIYRIGRAEFEKAYALVPFEGPGDISQIVRGPAYVWAILHDMRIRQADW